MTIYHRQHQQDEVNVSTGFGQKARVLIFGTGAGGVNFYKYNRRRYRVIGFVDNNQQKQGQRLFGKLIHAPQQLSSLAFDKIIIASDYYREIHPQLTEKLAINEQKVEVFHGAQISSQLPWFQRIGKRLEQLGYERLCRKPGLISDLLYRLFFRRQDTRRLALRWLDESDEHKVHVFRPSQPGTSQPPRFLHQSTPAITLALPEIALYHFRQGQVCSVSRSVILPGGQLVLERVPTAKSLQADYSAAHLLYHGQRLALVRTGKPIELEKGLLISGCNEQNYYHWTVEVLSQLQFVAELPPQYADYPLLISKSSQNIPSIKALIEAIGVDRPLVLLNNITSYQVADLLLISAPNNMIPNFKGAAQNNASSGFVRPESIHFLREKALHLAHDIPIGELPKRVFLARKGFLRHYNQAEILKLLEPYGFTCVYMEEQDINHQVAIMANAEVIVGPTGAAWTNLIFASKNARALCWMAEEYGQLSCFSNLAAIVGVEMDYIAYRVGSTDSRELYYRNYRVDAKSVENWLQQHLSKRLEGETR
ncbi:glycosyltransferase 61 family protein [Pseudomonas chlororaphis]|nr:glycosyltransferase 61 family protein [Pseudomonas chlororaphis]WDH21330.1 glycosyltransferase 61 family protein [Pseudomonas chlororaphis]